MKILRNNKILRIILIFLLCCFAGLGIIFSGVFVAMRLHLTDVKGSIDSRNNYFNKIKNQESRVADYYSSINSEWMKGNEFATFKEGVLKDKEIILKVSDITDVPSRLIVSSIMPEQLRFFTSNRESFKKFFEPLKILGTYSQFSYGISGIKIETAKEIETNLKDVNSPFYLGKDYVNLLDYSDTNNIDSQRLARFTDSHNHYYSYLYTAIYLKEIMQQWENSEFSINDRPEVLATLFNIGFKRSIPKENPEVGGSTITINNRDYTFGGLSYEFYYSGELSEFFPFEVQ
ncbi:TPA: hypothetical protein DEP30_02530 [Candidatus Nomurabacteria bacterium]|nr:MAG: hypothetical protein UR97_C0004G0012 [Candidatus Nomurabacteria bacterium GW2011_GWE2_36_115]KKP94143.1 MAG: hypothetical protein US00_C0003G0067 [Candidatus Nomurabacteria bacterium GW2011_GWF2_36_126]KKP96729.1 MAG: hypothetical protein US04_C0001G0231 [Candidatus Nomurabacteria bacterium GW2011_GWD2_36_14]KKP99667.1 MAG: hypothetical protein US08_C0001G0350 [Candidatus Nomurabacteria bacterium GW2011_GWF2_36_19]KKQ05388.1 MAG: hypothetical protein US17_C0005G0155 [Candidatus Nomuraba